jgi:hypothetical protein
MVSAKAAVEALLEDATHGVKVYDDAGAAGSGTFTNLTGTATGSPITLAHGANTPEITVAGTFTLTLPAGSVATVETGGWVVTGSPVSCVAGDTVITVEPGGAGTITVTVSTVPILIPGHVLDHWPGKEDFASYGWVITLGPVINADAQYSSLGALSKWIRESVQIDVWVMEKRGSTYAAEKTRSDLVQEIDRCLHHYAGSPGSGFNVVNLSGWRELDEVGLRRTSCTVVIEYEKAKV